MSSSKRCLSGRIRLLLPAIVVALALVGGAGSAAGSTDGAQVTPRIVGGGLAPAGSWPSIVALYDSGSTPFSGQFCGGTLIAKRWVLTAAHCVVDGAGITPAADVAVMAGRHRLSGSGGEQIGVSRVVPNPNYDDATATNDNALLELANASSQPVRAVVKPSQASYWAPGDSVYVAGWGSTVAQPAGCPGGVGCPSPTYPDELREVEVSVTSNADCESAYPGEYFEFSMVCAGIYPTGGKDSCQGDSGGPLEADTPAGRVLIGVVSTGDGCAAPGLPGIYNRTVNYRTWIGNYAATLAGTPSPLGFGKVKSGKKRFKSITLTGSSSLPATVGTYKVTGKGFKRAGGTCSTTIESAATCKVKIRFRPTSKKKRSGYLTVTSAKGVVYRKVKLVGTGR